MTATIQQPQCSEVFPSDPIRLEALRRTLHAEAKYILRRDDLADDAVQQVLIRLWQTNAEFDPDRGSLTKWLRFLTRRAAIDIIRHEVRQRRNESLGPTLSVNGGCPQSELDKAALKDDLDRVLSQIDDHERAAIELSHLGERSHAEVADELAVPLGTVKSRIRRGMHKLAAAAPDVIER